MQQVGDGNEDHERDKDKDEELRPSADAAASRNRGARIQRLKAISALLGLSIEEIARADATAALPQMDTDPWLVEQLLAAFRMLDSVERQREAVALVQQLARQQ